MRKIALIALSLAWIIGAVPTTARAMWCIPTQAAWYDECTVSPEHPGEPPAWCNTLRGRLGHAVMDLLGLAPGDGESNGIVPDPDDGTEYVGDPDEVVD